APLTLCQSCSVALLPSFPTRRSSDLRRRRLRRRVHGVSRVHGRRLGCEPAPRHGVRRGARLVRGRGLRRGGARGRDARRRARAGAGLQGPGALRHGRGEPPMTDRYAAAGVHLGTADEAKRRIAELVRRPRTELALGALGAFGGMVRLPPGYERPVLVLSTDGVGTKVLVAARAGVHDTVGEDLVHHCVHDTLGHGARPLAFLDYIATGTLEPETPDA